MFGLLLFVKTARSRSLVICVVFLCNGTIVMFGSYSEHFITSKTLKVSRYWIWTLLTEMLFAFDLILGAWHSTYRDWTFAWVAPRGDGGNFSTNLGGVPGQTEREAGELSQTSQTHGARKVRLITQVQYGPWGWLLVSWPVSQVSRPRATCPHIYTISIYLHNLRLIAWRSVVENWDKSEADFSCHFHADLDRFSKQL